MEMIALLRGVTPTGMNRIPSMAQVVTILSDAGFQDVRFYIQNGNLVLNSNLAKKQTALMIQSLIRQHIGADLPVIIKSKAQLQRALRANPFTTSYDLDRVHLVFTNDRIDVSKSQDLLKILNFIDEEVAVGKECYYLYLPKDARQKRLNTVFLERKLGILGTMRKLNVVKRLVNLAVNR